MSVIALLLAGGLTMVAIGVHISLLAPPHRSGILKSDWEICGHIITYSGATLVTLAALIRIWQWALSSGGTP